MAAHDEKRRLAAQLINALLPSREAAILLDDGGVLTDAGAFDPDFDGIVGNLDSRPHPPAVIIAPRMIRRKLRRSADDISYVSVKSLSRDWAGALYLDCFAKPV